MKRVYIAGPMTGIPQFNFPAFMDAAAQLRDRGYEVVSPAEIDNENTRNAALQSKDGAPGTGSANGETWGDFLARDVKLLVDDGIEAIFVLPGWRHSRGARLETFVGAAMKGMPIYCLPCSLDEGEPVSIPPYALETAWAGRADDFPGGMHP